MDKLRLQFWSALRYISTFLSLIFAGMAVVDAAGHMPHALKRHLNFLFPPLLDAYLPPQLHHVWLPLAIMAVLSLLIAQASSRRKRLWRPAGFEVIPAPDGGYLRKAGFSQFKKELKGAPAAARREARECFEAAERHFSRNRYKNAATEYQKSAFSVSTKSAYLNQGVSLCHISYFQKAKDAFDTGLPIAQREEDTRFEAAFLCNCGIVHRERGELNEALKCFKQAYGKGDQIGDSLGQACALGNIGSVYLLQGRIDEARKSWEKVCERFEQTRYAVGRAVALDSIGGVYGAKRQFKQALKYHRKARKIYRDIRNLVGETQTLANIGYVCLKLNRRRRSLRASRAALKLAEQLGSFLAQAKAHGNIGLAFEKKGKLEDALTSVQKSLELYKQVGNPVGVGNQLASIGTIYAAQDKKKEALLKWGEARSKFLLVGARSDGYHAVESALDLSVHDSP